MNKKAVIGTTLTWTVAMVIIIFILFLYIAGIMAFFGNKTLTEFKFPTSEVEFEEIKNVDLSHTKKMSKFIIENEEVIFNWVDDEDERDGAYWEVCNLFDNIKEFDLEHKSIYFEINDPITLLVPDNGEYRKTLLIEELDGKISCIPSLNNLVYKIQILSKTSFVSDEGDLMEVTYYEK